MTHDCAALGHVWLEADGRPYIRHRGRQRGPVSVTCRYCGTLTELEGHAGFTSGGPGSPKIGAEIPPQFKAVLDRALAESPPSTGPQATTK